MPSSLHLAQSIKKLAQLVAFGGALTRVTNSPGIVHKVFLEILFGASPLCIGPPGGNAGFRALIPDPFSVPAGLQTVVPEPQAQDAVLVIKAFWATLLVGTLSHTETIPTATMFRYLACNRRRRRLLHTNIAGFLADGSNKFSVMNIVAEILPEVTMWQVILAFIFFLFHEILPSHDLGEWGRQCHFLASSSVCSRNSASVFLLVVQHR